jgi:hypothetical protein
MLFPQLIVGSSADEILQKSFNIDRHFALIRLHGKPRSKIVVADYDTFLRR